MSRLTRIVASFVAVLVLVSSFQRTAAMSAVQRTSAKVVAVVDGDTADVLIRNQRVRLRMIGMNTPETKDPRTVVQCFGREASAKAQELLAGKTVALEGDPSQDTRDRYGRLLVYVWLPNGTLFNKEMIRLGYAHEYTYNVPYKYQRAFRAAQREAQQAQRALWSPATCNGKTEQPARDSTAPPVPQPPAPRQPASGTCDTSYPTLCIQPPPPDLDCGDIPYRRFPVRAPDPHRFDGDRDGIGCES